MKTILQLRAYFILALLVINFNILYAQKSITLRDKKNIEASASETLERFNLLLSFVSNPNNTRTEIDEAVQKSFDNNKIFFNEFELEDDSDPNVHSTGNSTVKITTYLKELQYQFKPKNTTSAVEFSHISLSDIYKGDKYMYIKVTYVEKFNGKNPEGIEFTNNNRIAEMQIIPLGNKWATYISDIYFAGRISAISPQVTIRDINDNTAEQQDIHDESYYSFMLSTGSKALKENKFGRAYFSFMEARNSDKIKTTVENQLDELKRIIMASNKIFSDYIYEELLKEAQDNERLYMIETARKYYIYALELNPTNKNELPKKIEQLNEGIRKERYLYSLYEKGLYEQAINEYTAALNSNKLNSNLYLGLAKSQWKMSDMTNAEKNFNLAADVNPGNLEIFRWQAVFYKDIGKYSDAYQTYVNYVNKLDKSDPALVSIYSEMSLCKGMMLYNEKNYQAAIDTIKTATKLNTQNAGVYILLSNCYKELKQYDVALKEVNKAIAIDDKIAEAYYLKGQITELNIKSTTDDPREEAIKYYKQAVDLEGTKPEWFFTLGNIHLELAAKELENINHARDYFTKCININNSTLLNSYLIRAYWKRGFCYYKINDFQNAKSDYDNCLKYFRKNPAFCVDYADLFLSLRNYDSAIAYYKNAVNQRDGAYGLGKAIYLKNPESGDKNSYLQYFSIACQKGVKREQFENEPLLKGLLDDGDFRKLMKSCK